MTGEKALTASQAAAGLSRLDPAEAARAAGGLYDPETRTVTIRHCGRPVRCRFADGALTWGDSGDAVDPADAVPLLHYLANAKEEARPAGELSSWRDLWDAEARRGLSLDRPVAALAEQYGRAPGIVLAQARALEAAAIGKFGDVRLDIPVFPHLTVTVMLRAADEEDGTPARAAFLFDAVARECLSAEDAVRVAEMLAERLGAD
jgi:hypothetical protein